MTLHTTPTSTGRGFPLEEFEARTARAQEFMQTQGLDALLLMTEPEVAYFAGFNSYFWQSPTRPWFLLVPSAGKPIAIVPGIGVKAVSETWITDIRTWASPNPDDEGVSVLAQTIREVAKKHQRIGLPLGPETHLRMPANDVEALREQIDGIAIADATGIVRSMRMIKSEREIKKLARICGLVSDAFYNVPSLIHAGLSEREAFSRFRIDILSRGADSVPFLIGTSGPGGYDDVVRFPSDRILQEGDILFLDTGSEFDGYFSDFDRNFALGHASDEAKSAYRLLHRATEAGLQSARPGVRTNDIWSAMASVLAEGGASASSIGRMGHGLGLRNTEWPSLMEDDDTIIMPGMVLAIEPGYEFAPGKFMLHEENIVVRDDGAELLSRRAPPELPIIG
ncbi:aminopeptidase P family protein (plasmid) [Aminobacter sp. SR38]|jgi:Xaa-Pro aminopeptidase|uniref:M24 family metallopeptidase n=1 Tax=Aminobacter sp. SR38 TaxID=2774562 RepID=UPI0017852188|nr:Xaa-Pro peptidase family protein [Aminobacter sp. SR38]QOF75103.1 aminopeptidase P family protein [Aminobacter sp. SR38]